MTAGHLLVRGPNWVGDLVMATPMLEAALASPRFERVTVALRAHLAPVLAGGPLERRVLPIRAGDDEVRLLRDARADAVILCSNSFGAAWRAFRAKIPLRAGTAGNGRSLLLTHRVVSPPKRKGSAPIPTPHLYRDLAGLFGIEVPDLHFKLYPDPAVTGAVRADLKARGLAPGEPYALACPGAAFGASKLWPPESYAAALDALHAERGLRGVVSGGPGEEPLLAAVVEHARSPVISLADAPRDLIRLKSAVAMAAVVLVGDSGPRFYAAALDVPCVTVMGPTHPGLTIATPWCTVLRLDLECSPCLEKTCPLGHQRCMRDLSPARVAAAAGELLDRRAAHAGA